MSGEWIDGDVRARALAAADVSDIADRVAATPDLESACALLGPTKWGHRIGEAATVEAAQRMIFEALLWQMRILAGWLPSEGVEAVRCCVLWFEIRNIEDRLAYFGGAPAEAPYELGRLGIISKRLAGTSNGADIRRLMAASAWGDADGAMSMRSGSGLRRVWHRESASRVARAPHLGRCGRLALRLRERASRSAQVAARWLRRHRLCPRAGDGRRRFRGPNRTCGTPRSGGGGRSARRVPGCCTARWAPRNRCWAP